MFLAAFISFCSFMFIMSHISRKWFARLVGYKGWVDLLLHGSILWMFLGTSTLGLLQAEAAGIMFSLYLRGYAYFLPTQRWSWRYRTWYTIRPRFWKNRQLAT